MLRPMGPTEGYYSIGGAVVHCRVGRCHVMDRSRKMIFPLSVLQRMALIKASRAREVVAQGGPDELKGPSGDTYGKNAPYMVHEEGTLTYTWYYECAGTHD